MTHLTANRDTPTSREKTAMTSKRTKTKTLVLMSLAAGLILAGCSSAADTTSKNLSAAADNFEISRSIVFINAITDKNLLTIEGRCSINDNGNQLEVTCKVGEDAYTKDFLGLSDNVTYVAHQLETASADPYHHRVILRPETLVPNFDLDTSGG